jgi:FtsH-binding integral membrane protein
MQIISLLFALLASIVTWFVVNDALGPIATLVAVTLIIGFAVVATGWTIRRDV